MGQLQCHSQRKSLYGLLYSRVFVVLLEVCSLVVLYHEFGDVRLRPFLQTSFDFVAVYSFVEGRYFRIFKLKWKQNISRKTKQDIALFNSFLRKKGEKDQPEKITPKTKPKELDNFSIITSFENKTEIGYQIVFTFCFLIQIF